MKLNQKGVKKDKVTIQRVAKSMGRKMLINPIYTAIFSLGEGQVIEAGGGNLSSSPQRCAQWSHFVTGQE